jgi:hypothetical protein
MASIGERVYNALFNASTPTVVGENESVTVQRQMRGNDIVSQEAVRETMVNYWDTIGPAIVGSDSPTAEYRQLKVYDGSPKRSDPAQIHVDHFIPEANFHNTPTPDPDYTDYERNKEDGTDVPIFNTVPDPSELEDTRRGYRVIIEDEKVQSDSIILPVINYLDRNEDNDLPDNYFHVSPGSTATIISQIEGEFQLFFEQKGAYFIKYSIWNFERNVDNRPNAVVFTSAP